MNGRGMEGSSQGLTEVLPQHLDGGTEGNHKIYSNVS